MYALYAQYNESDEQFTHHEKTSQFLLVWTLYDDNPMMIYRRTYLLLKSC